MLTRHILARGQIVIPRTIRDMLGINVGDEMVIEVEDNRIILLKKENVVDIFSEVCAKGPRKISMDEIKKELETRCGEGPSCM